MDLNSQINRDELINVFPKLKDDDNFEILSPSTSVYNCIAWAMQYDDRWVEPYVGPGCWWPKGVEQEMTSAALVHAFEAEGFVKTENRNPEEGFDKVVLYKKRDADEWTHAARILSETKEYSKFGQKWDGTHSAGVLEDTAKGLEDWSYGVAYAYMKREQSRHMPEKLSGTITVDDALLIAIKQKLKK